MQEKELGSPLALRRIPGTVGFGAAAACETIRNAALAQKKKATEFRRVSIVGFPPGFDFESEFVGVNCI